MASPTKRFYDGGKPGRRTVTSPYSASANLVRKQFHVRIPLGTGAVSTQTALLGIVPTSGGKVTAVSVVKQATVTGTSLTADVKQRSADGSTSTSVLNAAIDVKAATNNAASAGTLSGTAANLALTAGNALEVVVTASSITAGPGDLFVLVEWVPAEDTKSSGVYTSGKDLGA